MTIYIDHKQILDNVSTAICKLATDGTILYVNPAAEHLFQRSARKLLTKPLTQFIEVDQPKFWQAISNSQPLVVRTASIELINRPQKFSCDLSLSPLDNETLVEFITRDNSANQDQDAQVTERQNESLNLVRGIAHEIKNPLGGIRGAAQLLGKQLSDIELVDYTKIIVDESDRLRGLVDRMLGPKHKPKLAPMNLHEVAERAARLTTHQHPHIDIQRDYDPSMPVITGDANLLIQATLNVVNNAAQAVADTEHPAITIRTRVRRKCTLNGRLVKLAASLAIVDNGPGIEASQLSRIFFPMVSGRADGTGLGLPISQSIAQLHQGHIEAISEPGRTEFTLIIPIEDEQQ